MPSTVCEFSGLPVTRIPMLWKCGIPKRLQPKQFPILHLLSKCLPQRCQVRNLNRIALNYTTTDEHIRSTLHYILVRGLLGNYKRCTARPALGTRLSVFARFATPDSLVEAVRDHFSIVLYAMKMFIRHTVCLNPVLREHMVVQGSWEYFEQHVDETSIALCCDLDRLPHATFFARMTSFLEQRMARKASRVCAKRATSAGSRAIKTIVGQREKTDMVHKHFLCLYNACCRVPLGSRVPWYMLVTLGVSRRVIRELYSCTLSKDRLKAFFSAQDKVVIRQFLNTFHLRDKIRAYALPEHMVQSQLQALRRRFRVPAGVALDPHVARFLLCTQCRSLKSLPKASKNAARAAPRVYGNSAVLLDDVSLEYYCAHHKAHKNAAGHPPVPALPSFFSAFQAPEKDRAARKQRFDKYAHCERTPLLKIPSHGVLLYFFDQLYLLCPQCAWPYAVQSMGYFGEKFMCGQCAHALKITCT
jgi:hypothetical protein